jgi:hypothetical protein
MTMNYDATSLSLPNILVLLFKFLQSSRGLKMAKWRAFCYWDICKSLSYKKRNEQITE